MIAREALWIGGGLLAVLVTGGIAYAAAPAPAAAAGAAAPTLAFTAGHRYQIDLAVPAGAAAAVPTFAQAQASLDAVASAAFTLVGVGISYPGSSAPGSAYTVYFIVDCHRTVTVKQSDLLSGAPAGTTITATDNGLTPAVGSGAAAGGAGSSSTTTTSGAATPPATTTVTGSAPMLGGSAPQWVTSIALGTDTNVLATYWPGDTITVMLPTGASWATGGSSAGVPTSGSVLYSFTAADNLSDMTFAWTLGGLTYATTIHFQKGRTWAAATEWGPLDTVRISISSPGYAAMETAVQDPSAAAEVAALTAMSAQIAAQVAAGTLAQPNLVAQGFYYLMTTGPWAASLGVTADATAILADAPTLLCWSLSSNAGAASSFPPSAGSMPTDWPSDPTAILRAEFQCQGIARRSASSVPFPLSAWIRTT